MPVHFATTSAMSSGVTARILDTCLPGRQFIYLLLGLGHLAVSDLGDLAIVARPLGILGLYPVVLNLLPCLLQSGKYRLLFLPLLHQHIPLRIERLQVFVDLVHLHGHTLPLDGLALYLQLADPAVQVIDRFRHGIHLQPQLRCSLIHKVYRLVRKEPVGDIPVRKFHGSNQGIILDTHLVMVLVPLFQTPQDGY